MKIGSRAVADWGTAQDTLATSAAGYTSLDSQAASVVTISNSSGTSIEVVSGTTGDGVILASTAVMDFPVENNASEIGWRRSDLAASTATISYRWVI